MITRFFQGFFQNFLQSFFYGRAHSGIYNETSSKTYGLFLLLFLMNISSLSYGAAHYSSKKPFSKEIFNIKGNFIDQKGQQHWSKDQRGRYAEQFAQEIFLKAGFKECPAKYEAKLKQKRSLGPEQGIDGLFLRFPVLKLPVLKISALKLKEPHRPVIIANESKFQWRGGPPNLSRMGCRACSGGGGETDQMSWRWIHHSLESTITTQANYCAKDDQLCFLYCPDIIKALKDQPLEEIIIRTATVVDRYGTIHFYALYSNASELKRASEELIKIQRLLEKTGYPTKLLGKAICSKNRESERQNRFIQNGFIKAQ